MAAKMADAAHDHRANLALALVVVVVVAAAAAVWLRLCGCGCVAAAVWLWVRLWVRVIDLPPVEVVHQLKARISIRSRTDRQFSQHSLEQPDCPLPSLPLPLPLPLLLRLRLRLHRQCSGD